MAGLKQSKRVSWAPDVKLRQVRFFLSEDTPSQSRSGAQDNLQAKTSWLWHSTGTGSDDSPPPGFEEPQATYHFKKEIPQIPLIKWQCPSRLNLNPEWQVVAGEESKEARVQNHRQLGVLEAIYPRLSSIPPNPSVSSEIQENYYDDDRTPLIPITPIEDEDTSDSAEPIDSSNLLQQQDIPKGTAEAGKPPILPSSRLDGQQSQANAASTVPNPPPSGIGLIPGIEPDVAAAAQAAFTAIMRSNEEGSLIDRDLLIKILSNPNLIEKLVTEHGDPKKTSSQVTATSAPAPVSVRPPPVHVSLGASSASLPMVHIHPMPHAVVRPPLNPQPPFAADISTKHAVKAPTVKDRSYYKNLIERHGGEKLEAPDLNPVQFSNHQNYQNNVPEPRVQGLKQGDPKPKIPKPCVYFNSPRGCWHGANCLYQHDGPPPLPSRVEKQDRKRVKLDREIAGRT